MGDYTAQLLTPTLSMPTAGAVGAGNSAAEWFAPCDCKLMHAQCTVETVGGTSGATTVMIRNDNETLDMLSAVMSIAYNASDPVAVEGTLHGTAANLLVSDGDRIDVDVDTVGGGALETGLVVNLVLVGR